MILNFLKRYKTPLIAVALVWAFIAFLQYYAISPLKEQTNELKKEVKKREKENEALKQELKKDSILIVKKEAKIKVLEEKQKYYQNLEPKIKIKYEKAKTDYISRDVIERRRIFAKTANEK